MSEASRGLAPLVSDRILVARLPPARPAWEPMIVTTLRRYLRRGAPTSLIHRIAGGASHYHTLNRFWDLDGKVMVYAAALLAPDDAGPTRRARRPEPLGVNLSAPERRIALLQLIVDCKAAGRQLPVTVTIAHYLGVSPST